MNTQNLTLLAVSITAILAVGSIGLEYIQITAEEKEEKFKMADDVTVTGIFTFRDGTEIIDIQTFNQESGFEVETVEAFNGNIRAQPVFYIEKIPGASPLLYEAADDAWFFRGRTIAQDYDNKFFNVEIIIARGGDLIRTFDYKQCTVSGYAVATLSDKEEAYMGKGFAVIDTFEIECDGYQPQNSELQMIQHKESMAKKNGNVQTVSTMDLRETSTWAEQMKYQNYKP